MEIDLLVGLYHMKNKTQRCREKLLLTQSELAEKSGLSLRTIQRIEAGTIPKGYTLKRLSEALGVAPNELIDEPPNIEVNIARVKIINLSALSMLILPFGNLIVPAILTHYSKEESTKSFGRSILGLQLVWSCITGFLLMIAPFLQAALSTPLPLILIVLFLALIVNAFIIFRNAISLSTRGVLHKHVAHNIL